MKKLILLFTLLFLTTNCFSFGVIDEDGNQVSYDEYMENQNKEREAKYTKLDLPNSLDDSEKIDYLLNKNNFSLSNFNVKDFKTEITNIKKDAGGSYHVLLEYSYKGIYFDNNYGIHFYPNGDLMGLFENPNEVVRAFIYPQGYEKKFRTDNLNEHSVIYFDESKLITKPEISKFKSKLLFLKKVNFIQKIKLTLTNFYGYDIELKYWDKNIHELSDVKLVWKFEGSGSEYFRVDAITGEELGYFDGTIID
jgi:hypothetical protein